MRQRLFFFLISAASAMLIMIMIHSALKNKQKEINELRGGQVSIVIATHVLWPGATIGSQSVRLAAWPRAYLPSGALTKVQEAVGKRVKQPIVQNQPIVASALLSNEKTGGILPLLIPDGMRAMSIPVNDVSDMAGLILPYSRVDVVVSVSTGQGDATESATVLQNVEVLAVGARIGGAINKPQQAKVVTLLVSPLDAEKLATATRLGVLHLAMRNYGDEREARVAGVSSVELLRQSAGRSFGRPAEQSLGNPVDALQAGTAITPERVGGRAVRVRAVEVIRNGKKRQTVSFIAGQRAAYHPSPEAQSSPQGAVQAGTASVLPN